MQVTWYYINIGGKSLIKIKGVVNENLELVKQTNSVTFV